MIFFKEKKTYRLDRKNLQIFLNKFWFVPSDVLQRSIEANIWDLCRFEPPVLSIGIGNGEVDSILFKNQITMDVGIDLDSSQLETARNLGIYKKVMAVNAEKMPFKDSSFRTVVSNSTFEHIRNDKRAVSEVSRVLKPGGLFLFTTPSNFLKRWILEWENGSGKEKEKLDLFNRRAGHFHYHSYAIWENLLRNNNMEIAFHRFYFKKSVATIWYRLFSIFTKSIRSKEIWSYLGHSKLTKIVPHGLIIKFLLNNGFIGIYEKAFFTQDEPGAQHFIIARKVRHLSERNKV